MTELTSFVINFIFNLLVAVILVRFIYYPTSNNKRYVFTFLAFNTVIYFVLSFMASIELGIGVGFGLFAIFSILRYRTDPIPVREMTYLFVISALPVMNSIGVDGSSGLQLVAANLTILLLMMVLEREWGFRYEASKRILYEKIELIRPDCRNELLADLENRTGLKIKKVAIGKVDFLHDTADVKIFYDDTTQEHWLVNAEPSVVVVARDDPNGS
jgi:hypothetical protein